MTLVEVMAALALLAGLLTATLMASARLKEQAAKASLQSQAAKAADDLLESLWPDRHEIDRNGAGSIPGHPGWRYEAGSRPATQGTLGDLEAEIVTFEIYPPPSREPAMTVRIVLAKEPADG
jgi:hypothetical protein